ARLMSLNTLESCAKSVLWIFKSLTKRTPLKLSRCSLVCHAFTAHELPHEKSNVNPQHQWVVVFGDNPLYPNLVRLCVAGLEGSKPTRLLTTAEAMQFLLDLLYAGKSLQRWTFEKRDRNAEIYR